MLGSADGRKRAYRYCNVLVGGVADWLERRFVAGGLSSIDAWSVVYMWPLWVKCLLWVNKPNQLSLPSLRGR